MVILIVLLYALITITFAVNWLRVHSAFVKNGQNFWTVFLTLTTSMGLADILEGIASSMSTILTDSYMIWCCWIVWGQCWPVVLLPIVFLISAAGKVFLLASTLLPTCIPLHFLYWHDPNTIAGVKHRENGRLRVYQHFLEVLVESSGLYTISLVVYLALAIPQDSRMFYLDAIVAIAKGVAPTLIIGHFMAKHQACPDDSWQGSVIGSASIRSQEQEHSQMSFQEDDWTSPMLDGDLEAQPRSSFREPSPALCSVSVVANYVHANTDVSLEASPHSQSCQLLHVHSSLCEDATHDSTMVDEATALS
ncbi:hypothetical protein EDD18DRAFT_1353855 [Armillaria luteobubalina]|uniref:Uncharacterized protein n=1 Tax=Armillaria luteobubalina TaxID=153913 RepID=A0AA39Q5H4_9AGAR|nr:hypothetical protein EDD18DRAFT_1353855 [Armillaria luteobubalina]